MVNLNINNEAGKHIAQYMLQGNDRIDNLTLGMLVNNNIEGIVPVKPVQVGSDRFFRYDIDGMITLAEYLGEYVKKERILKAFYGIAVTIKLSMEYMINWTSFALDLNSIYVKESEDKTELICVPLLTVINDGNTCNFFKNILFTAQFDADESEDYVGKLIMSLNPKTYTIEKFIHELEDMLGIAHMVFDVQEEEEDESTETDVQNTTKDAAQSAGKSEKAENDNASGEENAEDVQDSEDNSNRETEESKADEAAEELKKDDSIVATEDSVEPTGVDTVEEQKDAYNDDAAIQQETDKIEQPEAQEATNNVDVVEEQIESDNSEQERASGTVAEEIQQQAYREGTVEVQNEAYSTGAAEVQNEAYSAGVVEEQQVYREETVEAQSEAYNAVTTEQQEDNNVEIAEASYHQEVPEQNGGAVENEVSEQQYAYSDVSVQEAGDTGKAYVEDTQAQTDSSVEVAESNPYISAYNPYATDGTDNGYGAETDYDKLPFLIRESTKQRYYIDKDKFLIGSDEAQVDCFISDNDNIDEVHAIIIKQDKEYFVVDNNSKKGTYMNFVELMPEEESYLPHGVHLSLADEEFIFKMHE